ncbi:Riboflavin synthase-like beta-barrel [Ascosphaera apis ARSEF 7405]|uniref:assimilatory sulfite reductase (NADPH) n=1 Tax=Ascosphaera apis ARSEF 7405 TaxID=392613 RepID=A0A167VC81_9EURO|nr:Riboflavin synthase-like beta-barrel [Ascosphaera apis ARSEF 7405]
MGSFAIEKADQEVLPYDSIGGPTYITAQTLIQQVSYALSDKLFTYSPETFDLDTAVKQWANTGEKNANGYKTSVQPMQTRQGAGTIALGYIFSQDFDLKKRHIPQTIIASSATLQYLRSSLEQLTLLYSVANPFVAHVSAVDYRGGSDGHLVTDYHTALRLSEELGLGLVATASTHESQHMALFSTLLAKFLPTLHIYDGIKIGRENTRVIDVFSQSHLNSLVKSIYKTLEGTTTQKHLDVEGKLLGLLQAFNDELGTDYKPFEYHGHAEATSILVTFGTVESSLTAQIADALAQSDVKVGVVNVRIYRPFVEEEFLKVLPASAQTIGILGQVPSELDVQEEGVHSPLYEDNEKVTALLGNDSSIPSAVASHENILRRIDVPESWGTLEEETTEEENAKLPSDITPTSLVPFDKAEEEAPAQLDNWQSIAKSLVFREAYDTKAVLRPDLATKTYTIHVSANKRLTPESYERNIFHIEFDLGDSGLTYDIGEALGIHAENDPEQIEEFIKFYGLDPNAIVPVPSREDEAVFEVRTVYQALLYNIDLFGKPPKRFYEALAEYATDEKEKAKLQRLGGEEGTAEVKKRAEIDFLTYADILYEFPSARPSFTDLVRIVNPMKRREYSIASCQKVTPTSVALMIVVVDWIDSQGRKRWGQASRYLSKLQPGTAVTASVKPSVMKLPPSSTQPLIMAGLGTGLAPFRAFVQHRALEKAQGKEIGSVLLYMGSRHQREEYCYGEEWEAYQAAGVITLLGRAFSRDQPHKVYIQDRMRETLPEITQAYTREKGAFYLCGPTWPVPDVTAVLEEAIAAEAKANGKKVDTKRRD